MVSSWKLSCWFVDDQWHRMRSLYPVVVCVRAAVSVSCWCVDFCGILRTGIDNQSTTNSFTEPVFLRMRSDCAFNVNYWNGRCRPLLTKPNELDFTVQTIVKYCSVLLRSFGSVVMSVMQAMCWILINVLFYVNWSFPHYYYYLFYAICCEKSNEILNICQISNENLK